MADKIRWILTAALLYPVWVNSHWSVALVLTLMTLRIEAEEWTMKTRAQIRRLNSRSLD